MVSLTDELSRELLDSQPQPILVLEDIEVVYLNEAAARLIGSSRTESLLGAGFTSFLESGAAPRDFTTGRRWCDVLRRLDGSTQQVEIESAPLSRPGATHPLTRISVLSSSTDSPAPERLDTRKRLVEEQLRETHSELRAIFQALPDLYLRLDDQGQVLEHSTPALSEETLSTEGLRGHPLQDALPSGDRKRLSAAIRGALLSGTMTTLEFCSENGGQPRRFELRLVPYSPDRLVAIVRDVTEQKRLENRKHRARKMESLGRLAGGIAHDFNNLLTTVVAHSEFARLDAGSRGHLFSHLDQIALAVDRASELTRKLLAFSQGHVTDTRVVDAARLVSGMIDLIRRVTGDEIELRPILTDLPCPIRANQHLLEKALVNLIFNARDAMQEGGCLTLVARPVNVGPRFASKCEGLAPGRHVQITVHDNGVGMSEQTRGLIFDPFFTTKGLGEGSGMGLPTCYGIVRQLGGHIAVFSRPGRATAIIIYLPLTEAPHQNGTPSPGAGANGKHSVLLVEDDMLVREVIAKALRTLGYVVLEASGGHEALDIAATTEPPIDLLVTDIVMPQLDGHQLVGLLRAERPDLKVLYISGFTRSALCSDDLRKPGTAFLHKPFTRADLKQRLLELQGDPAG